MNLVENSLHSCGTLLCGTLEGLALIRTASGVIVVVAERTASGVIVVVGELSPVEVEFQSPMFLHDTPKASANISAQT